MSEAAPTRSHNNPPEPVEPEPLISIDGLPDKLAADWKHKVAREAELHAGFIRFQTAALAVDLGDVSFAEKATEFAKQLRDEWSLAKGVHEKVKAPVLTASRTIDAFFLRGIVEPLKADLDAVMSWITRHQRHRAAEAQRKADEERQRQLDEAATLAAAAEQSGDTGAVEQAIDAEQKAMETAAEPQPAPVQVSRVRGEFGATASLTGTWRAVVENADLLPRQYLVPSMPLIEAAMKASRINKGPPTVKIAGVRFEQEQKARIR